MSIDPTLDPSTRRIINSNRGVTNIACIDNERFNIVRLLQKFIDLLFKHCGPLSKYAMTVNSDSAGIAFEPNVFTRDGIDILSAVECMSPLETYIKELLCYLGGRVDSAAKDGTTTSMLFGAMFLQMLLRNKIYDDELTSYMKKKYTKEVFDDILDSLVANKAVWHIGKLCEDDPSEKNAMKYAGYIAFCQAMSSSGGDIELALAMKHIYERSPRITWDFIEYYQSASETGARFSVEVDEFDSRLRCTATQEGALNSALGTEYEAEEVRCIIYPDSFSTYDTKLDQMIYYLKEVDDEHPVVLVMTHVPAQLLSALMQINESRKNKITVWQYCAEDKLAGQALNWEMMVVNAIAGITPFNRAISDEAMSDEYTFIAKKVCWKNSYMEFYGTVESNDEDCLHPYYADPSKATPYYKEVLDALLAQREMYSNGRVKNEKLVGIFTEMLNRIACLHRPKLRLGGPAHEQIASMPVVKDVQGAIMSSLKHGFLTSGVLDILWSINEGTFTNYSQYQYQLLTFIANAFLSINNFIYTKRVISYSEDWSSIKNNIDKFLSSINFVKLPGNFDERDVELYSNCLSHESESKEVCSGYAVNIRTLGKLTEYFKLIDKYEEILERWTSDDNPNLIASRISINKLEDELSTTYPVTQPIKITEELFKRTQELLMKFSSVSEIIVYGGVVVKEND